MFNLLESRRDTLRVQEYSVSQTSLEQIFNQFASQQEEEDSNIIGNTTVGSGNVKAKPSAAVIPTTVSVNVGDSSGNSAAVVPITNPESDTV